MGHRIVPDSAGWPEFGWLIVVFVIGTVIFALSLQALIAKMRRLEMMVHTLMEKRQKNENEVTEAVTPPTESRSWARGFLALPTTIGLRRRRRQNEMDMESRGFEIQ